MNIAYKQNSYQFLFKGPVTLVGNDMERFFLFGCWNREGCEKNENLSKVIKKLKTDDFDFGIIAGDNVYPIVNIDQGGTKQKYYDPKISDAGYACLMRNISKPMFWVLGNHDVDSCEVALRQVQKNDVSFQKNDDKQTIVAGKLIFPNNYYNFVSNLANFIFIDTNLFDKDTNCYAGIDWKVELDSMLNWVNDVLGKSKSTWNIIVGHAPIGGFRTKGIRMLIGYEKLLNILQRHGNKNLIYMCADIHNFQYLTIIRNEFILPVIVSGTGGALPDLKEKYSNTVEAQIDDIKLNLIQLQDSYGYVVVKMNNDNFNFVYKNISGKEWEYNIESKPLQRGGANFKRYQRYKDRYQLLSNLGDIIG